MGKNSFLIWGFLLCSWMRGTCGGKLCVMLCLTCSCQLRLTSLRKHWTALVFGSFFSMRFCYKQPQTYLYVRSKTHSFCHWDALWWLLLGDKSKTLISLYTFRLSLAFYDAAHYVWQYLSTVSLPSVYYDMSTGHNLNSRFTGEWW